MNRRASTAPASPRPRVASFITGLGRGGAEVALLRLLAATSADFEHLVISLRGGGELKTDFRNAGIKVFDLGSGIWTARRLLADFEPDVLTAHMYHAAVGAVILGRLAAPKRALFWTIHHSLNALASEGRSTRLVLRACRALSAAPQAIIYVSQRSAEQHAAYGFPADKSIVIPNGYDLDAFRPDDAAGQRLRDEWGFADDDIVVGHVARAHPMKDHANMITAFHLAADREPRLRLVLCGSGTRELDLPSAIEARVRKLGPRSDVGQVMSACDVGCLSSAFGEAFPNVLAEFMACERQCVTTDVGDAAAIVGATGSVVPPRQPAALAQALIAVARRGKTERADAGRAARQSILERFDISSVAARHARLWRTAIGGRRR